MAATPADFLMSKLATIDVESLDWHQLYEYAAEPSPMAAEPYYDAMDFAAAQLPLACGPDAEAESESEMCVPHTPPSHDGSPASSLPSPASPANNGSERTFSKPASRKGTPHSRPLYNPDDFNWPEATLTLPLKEFNAYIRRQRLSAENTKRLKKERRRFQGRGYARKARARRDKSSTSAETDLKTLKAQMSDAMSRLQAVKEENRRLQLREQRILQLVRLHHLDIPELEEYQPAV